MGFLTQCFVFFLSEKLNLEAFGSEWFYHLARDEYSKPLKPLCFPSQSNQSHYDIRENESLSKNVGKIILVTKISVK